MGVSNTIWEEPGPLGSGSGNVFGSTHFRSEARAVGRACAIGARPADTTSGSTAPAITGLPGAALSPARILAAADSYWAMSEARPYRPALGADAAEVELRGTPYQGGSTGKPRKRCSRPPATARRRDRGRCPAG